MSQPLPLEQTDAMTIMMVVSEALMSVQIETLTPDAAAGVCLLYDRIMSRIEPLLPRDPELAHIFSLLNTVRATANAYCEIHNLPTRQ
jgi:hypothetical protein